MSISILMKILIIGDSFAADWTVKYPDLWGWPNLLSKKYDVTNLAQAGVSEYKIYKQLCSVNVIDYDLAIVAHTSPYRLVTRKHPIHSDDILHGNCDLIYSDIEHHNLKSKNKSNLSLQTAYWFFAYHYDEEYQETTYKLFREKIEYLLTIPTIIITDFDDWSDIIDRYRGKCNHLSDAGNNIIYERIVSKIGKLVI